MFVHMLNNSRCVWWDHIHFSLWRSASKLGRRKGGWQIQIYVPPLTLLKILEEIVRTHSLHDIITKCYFEKQVVTLCEIATFMQNEDQQLTYCGIKMVSFCSSYTFTASSHLLTAVGTLQLLRVMSCDCTDLQKHIHQF